MDQTSEVLPAAAVRPIQIIASALMLGVLVFLGIAIYLVQTGGVKPAETPMISYMSAGFFIVVGVVWFIVPAQIMNAQVRRIATGTYTPPVPPRPPAILSDD